MTLTAPQASGATACCIHDDVTTGAFSSPVLLDLDVTLGDAPAYRARTGEYLTRARCGSVAPGRRLIVKVHPDDPQRIAVDWWQSLRPVAQEDPVT